MANKVLVGVGIGCGVLVLLGVIAGGVVAYMAKKTFGGTIEAGQQMAAQDNDLKALEKSFPFTTPAQGEVLALQEARLNDYFTIREAALPVFKDFEQKSEALNNAEETSLSDGLKAASMLAEFMTKTRGVYIDNLKKHRMSPSEFNAITTAIYTSAFTNQMGQMQQGMDNQREQAEKMLAEVRTKLEDANLSEEERTALQEQETVYQAQVEAMSGTALGESVPQLDEKAQGVAAANLELLKKFDERIKTAYNPAFDSIIMTADTAGGGLGGMVPQPQGE